MKVLFVSAHPDDIESRMGGTAAKYKAKGADLFYLIATNGQKGGTKIKKYGDELGRMRKEEALRAASYLNAKVEFLGFEDKKLNNEERSKEAVEAVITKINPDVTFTLTPNDYHTDHRAISEIVMDIGKGPIFLCDTLIGVEFEPEYYVDVTEYMEMKHKMLSEHKSQNFEALIEYSKVVNRFRGLQNNLYGEKYAEAYRLFKRSGLLSSYKLLP